MNLVLTSEDDYENVALRHDPTFAGVEELIGVLKEFIRSKGLIIYGGLAIDYALRLHGDKIYSDTLLQVDYDFLSPDNVEHAYDCADMFYAILRNRDEDAAAGVRSINALHVKTMRVDIGDNHFLADVTYCPKVIFNSIPTLEYEGIKIIHPDMQRIDIHSSLSFPYDNAPMEVIFNRWKKDIKRFNLLAKYYPLTTSEMVTTDEYIEVPSTTFVLCGMNAYGMIYESLRRRYSDLPKDIIAPEGVHGGEKARLFGSVYEIVHFAPEKCVEKLKLAHVKKYRPVINMIPETITGMAEFGKVKIDITTGRLLSTVSTEIDGKVYRIACVQYLLKQFLSAHHYSRMNGDDTNKYLQLYVSLISLMEFERAKVQESTATVAQLSITTYGADNVSLSKEVAMRRVFADIGQATADYLPNNYYPARRAEGVLRPQYDFSRNKIFAESGEEEKNSD